MMWRVHRVTFGGYAANGTVRAHFIAMHSHQESRLEAFAKQEDGDGSPAVLARPSQEHLDAAAKFQLALQRQRSGQLPATSAPAPAAAASSRHPFLGRQSPTVKAEARHTRQPMPLKRLHDTILTPLWVS